ncbi:FAD-dependent oxidoreductase [Micrococcales bacterium 31B]|nr:FAD-dependent oxidoreductase [Micrococcales bacterium 31B]
MIQPENPAPAASAPHATTCAIVGGGPAGLMLGLVLARAGVRVMVLEKHADFLRDFRGDTVHPSTLRALDDLGLIDEVLARPHSKLSRATVPRSDGTQVVIADFARVPTKYQFIAMMPQWDFLDVLASAAGAYPNFTLLMRHEVTGVTQARGRVTGVTYHAPEGTGELAADLVIACDGRGSRVRADLALAPRSYRVPFDAWWVRIPTTSWVAESLIPRVGDGAVVIAFPREGYLQVAYLQPKGTDAALRARGLEAFRSALAARLPEVGDAVTGIESLDDVKHLDVKLDRLTRWHAPGALCLGDAAHAMSPAGGVGVNLAVQDAIAAARMLAEPLRAGTFAARGAEPWPAEAGRLLAAVQRRRTLPTLAIQGLQRVLHARMIGPALAGRVQGFPDAGLALFERFPALTGVPARLMGLGVRPERVPAWARQRAR